MTALPMRRWHVHHRRVLLGLFFCSGAGAEIAITNTFTPVTTQVGGTTTYALTVSNTEVIALTGTRLTHTLTGVSSVADNTATSTCKVTVQVKGGATPNSSVTTIPVESLRNDWGRINWYAVNASVNSTPLHDYQVQGRTTDPQTSPNTHGDSAKGWRTTTAGIELTNPNHTLLKSMGNTL